MRTERDVELLIVELENWISQIKRENSNDKDAAILILIANEKINVLKWVLDDI
jgi:phage-related holin